MYKIDRRGSENRILGQTPDPCDKIYFLIAVNINMIKFISSQML